MEDGSIHLSRTGMNSIVDHGRGQRTNLPTALGAPMASHLGSIRAIKHLGNTTLLATTANDGFVKVWDVTFGCMWTSPNQMRCKSTRADEGSVLAFVSTALDSAILAVGTQAGKVYIWILDTLHYTLTSSYELPCPTSDNTKSGQARKVQYLEINARDHSVMVQYEEHSHFYRLDWIDRLVPKVTIFGHANDYISSITALSAGFGMHGDSITAQDPCLNSGSLEYIVAGDDQGRTFIWDWKTSTVEDNVAKPIRQFQGFEAKVTAIETTELLVLIGT